MLLAKACPRCTGDVTRVVDVGETYYSCLQCGFISYQRPEPDDTAEQEAPTRRMPAPVDRSLVRRRQLRRERRAA